MRIKLLNILTDSYIEAAAAERKAELTSDVSSDNGRTRRKKSVRIVDDTSDEDSDFRPRNSKKNNGNDLHTVNLPLPKPPVQSAETRVITEYEEAQSVNDVSYINEEDLHEAFNANNGLRRVVSFETSKLLLILHKTV